MGTVQAGNWFQEVCLKMIDEETVSKVFEDAVEQRIERQKANRDSTYLDGVTAALGWVLEEYEESPME